MVLVLVLLVLVWWLRGARGWRIDEEVLVTSRPEEVFAVLDDPERAPELNPRIRRVEVFGDRERYHMRVGRRDVSLDVITTRREPPELLAHEVVAVRVGGKAVEAGTQHQTFELRPQDSGTRVRVTIRGEATGVRSRLTIGVLHSREAREARKVLRRLRDYASAPAREP